MAIHAYIQRSSQVVYGVNSKFKINISGANQRKSLKLQVLHLGKAKPERVIETVNFQAVYSGTLVEIGDFNYVSEDGMLSINNVAAAVGIELDPADTPAIPLGEAIDFQIAISTLHATKDALV